MLSRKEIVSILLLLTALICILNAALFGNIMPLSTSYEQLAEQTINAGTAYICILYALSTWVYHSNYSEPRRQIRYVLIAMLILLIAANLTGLITVIQTLFISDLMDALSTRDLFSSFGYLCRTVTAVLFVITLLLLIIILIIVTITAFKHSWSISSRQDSKEDLP
ncbi:uncharacterized protein [Drosophila virilis]|uniref:Uncharacterized protein, isoform A n=1 Tax=Drosophila virilis TaxID=7244 RepID=B4M6L0_DROVI|nr:uncharacterized protein LOC6632473 isoform X1 [Drosophila virilis]EDW59286.1 uncharacterized protein Dvir_GJ10367, isoform A [Drosophila virilis]